MVSRSRDEDWGPDCILVAASIFYPLEGRTRDGLGGLMQDPVSSLEQSLADL